MKNDNLTNLIKATIPITDALKYAIEIKDLNGDRVYANSSFNDMRKRGSREFVVDENDIYLDDVKVGGISVYHDMSEITRLKMEISRLNKKLRKVERRYTFADIIGRDVELLKVVQTAKIAATTPATIMLRGESGTGKELFANAIHGASKRRTEKFLKINCNSIPEELLESELFGYKDGSFTGSRRGGKVGLFKEADGGTLFLDEIGDISLKMQVKLLRVLQEKEIMPIGATEPEFVDVRIICATNKPLEKMIRNGEFREDLYYRLNVFPIVIPPLRERKTDIGIIVMHIIEKYNEFYERHVSRIDEDALELLYEEDWPGNVRELENVISRALINSREDNDVLSRSDIEFALKGMNVKTEPSRIMYHMDIPDNLNTAINMFESFCIRETIDKCGGDKNKAANILGIPIRTLYYKCRKLGL